MALGYTTGWRAITTGNPCTDRTEHETQTDCTEVNKKWVCCIVAISCVVVGTPRGVCSHWKLYSLMVFELVAKLWTQSSQQDWT